MRRIFAVFLFFILLVASNEVFATKLPDNEVKALKQTFKDMKVRFDGMVELSDGTKYIPVFPLQEKAQNPTKVIMTLPKNKPLKQKPDFFMFNTNMAFFKIVKKDEDKTTVIYNEAIPMDVKMGLFPQDLLVPTGFEIPGELRILIGDLVVPVLPNKEFREVNLITGQEVKGSPRTKIVAQAAKQVSNKYFYATSFNQNVVSVLNADNGKAFKQIAFSSIPSDIKLSAEGRYLLVSTIKNGNIFVIDTPTAKVLKELKVGEKPSYITISDKENLAYITNRGENSISVLDLASMQLKDPITVKGHPCNMEVAYDGLIIYYLDAITGIVYEMQRTDSYFNPTNIKPLFRTNNVSKIQYVDNKIYTLDRGKNELDIFYTKDKEKKEGIVDVADITPVKSDDTEKNIKSAVNSQDVQVDTAIESDENVILNDEKPKEKLTFKQRTRKICRKILYYPEDDAEDKVALNPENQVEVFHNTTKNPIPTVKSENETDNPDEVSDNNNEETEEEMTSKEKIAQSYSKCKKAFLDYMGYEPVKKEQTPIETIQIAVEKKMDFIKLDDRANDFIINNEKIYLLAADSYKVYVYDAKTNKPMGTIELDKKGYYNSIKISKDKTIGILTNINSKELVLFDTETDKVIQTLPVSVNVHNVVITGRKK